MSSNNVVISDELHEKYNEYCKLYKLNKNYDTKKYASDFYNKNKDNQEFKDLRNTKARESYNTRKIMSPIITDTTIPPKIPKTGKTPEEKKLYNKTYYNTHKKPTLPVIN